MKLKKFMPPSNVLKVVHSRVIGTFVSSVLYLIFIFLYHKLSCDQKQQQVSRIPLVEEDSIVRTHKKIIILYWTKFFGSTDFGFGLGHAPFTKCEHGIRGSCLTTTNRGLINESTTVIFHARDLSPQDLPNPEWRHPFQNYIFLLFESPLNTDMEMLRLPVFQNYFNRTMTYRRDSDFVTVYPYGRMKCISESPFCLNYPLANGKTSRQLLPKQDTSAAFIPKYVDLTSKNRTIAWFASNCFSSSNRESLVQKLSLYIPVDIYGNCGNGSHKCQNESDCNYMLRKFYRFYLSFENSLCPDYVTEKLYRALSHDTIPIVYGGSDYLSYLPAGSYLDIMDFDHPQNLAKYLLKLMANDILYLNHFWWKRQYFIDPVPIDGWCQLCKFDQNLYNKHKTYEDMAMWWSGKLTNKSCLSSPKPLHSKN